MIVNFIKSKLQRLKSNKIMNIEKKALTEGILKSMFGQIPYIGGILNEIIFDYRVRLKQERLNIFVAKLVDYFSNIKEENIDWENIKSEEFSDFFEVIFKKVAETSSENRLERLKKVFINEITQPYSGDFRETFLNISLLLQDKQIEILKYHSLIPQSAIGLQGEIQMLDFEGQLNPDKFQFRIGDIEAIIDGDENKKAERLKEKEAQRIKIEEKEKLIEDSKKIIQDKIDKYKAYRTPEFYQIKQSEFNFFVQDMISKALLYDCGIGSHLDSKPMEEFAITDFGREFLNFLKEPI